MFPLSKFVHIIKMVMLFKNWPQNPKMFRGIQKTAHVLKNLFLILKIVRVFKNSQIMFGISLKFDANFKAFRRIKKCSWITTHVCKLEKIFYKSKKVHWFHKMFIDSEKCSQLYFFTNYKIVPKFKTNLHQFIKWSQI